MKKEILIDGIKYKKVKDDEEEVGWVKGQGYVFFVLFGSIVMLIVSSIFLEWISASISLLLILATGGIGFDGLDYLDNRIDKLSQNIGNKKK